ncbi:putative leader peptide [Streptomyces sp. NPDC001930]|uniref:putative leader peptide n=1 Tax=Streptomyces sp. NPDC001930 TaxID=3364625 RepID=UPI0036BCADC8
MNERRADRRTDRRTAHRAARRTARCVPTASPAPLVLTRRRHIDLARVTGAGCR